MRPETRIVFLLALGWCLLTSCSPNPTASPTAVPVPSLLPPPTTIVPQPTVPEYPPPPTALPPTSTPVPSPTPPPTRTPTPTSSPPPTITPIPTATPTPTPIPTPLPELFRLVTPIDEVLPGAISALHPSTDGGLWLLTDQGVAKLVESTWNVYLTDFTGELAGIDTAGRVWVVSEDTHEISAWDGDSWTVYGTDAGWTPLAEHL